MGGNWKVKYLQVTNQVDSFQIGDVRISVRLEDEGNEIHYNILLQIFHNLTLYFITLSNKL